MLVLLYLMAYLDKTNIGTYDYFNTMKLPRLTELQGNAKIEGLTEDLKMRGIDYNVAVAIFFIPFVLFGKTWCSLSMTKAANTS